MESTKEGWTYSYDKELFFCRLEKGSRDAIIRKGCSFVIILQNGSVPVYDTPSHS